MPGVTITADEDVTVGFMLVDEHAPKTPAERIAVFVTLAARDWEEVFDPRQLEHDDSEPFAVVDDPEGEMWRAVREGEEPTAPLVRLHEPRRRQGPRSVSARPSAHRVAWALTGVSPRAILGRHSLEHVVIDDSPRTLCGRRIPWTRVHGSNAGRCARCWTIAEREALNVP